MFKFKFCFHKWEYILDSYSDTFLGEEITRYYTRFRICKKCNKVQKRYHFSAEDFYWEDLRKEEIEVLNKKLKEGMLIKESEYEVKDKYDWDSFLKDLIEIQSINNQTRR